MCRPRRSSTFTQLVPASTLTTADVDSQRSLDTLRTAAKSAALRAELAMLARSLQAQLLRSERRLRRARRPRDRRQCEPPHGRALRAHPRQTPRFFSNSTLPNSSAVVRLSAFGASRIVGRGSDNHFCAQRGERKGRRQPCRACSDHRHLCHKRLCHAVRSTPLFGRRLSLPIRLAGRRGGCSRWLHGPSHLLRYFRCLPREVATRSKNNPCTRSNH